MWLIQGFAQFCQMAQAKRNVISSLEKNKLNILCLNYE